MVPACSDAIIEPDGHGPSARLHRRRLECGRAEPARPAHHISAARAGVTLPQHPLPARVADELAPPPTGWRRLLVEPARPRSIATRADAHWLAVGTVCIGAFMGQLDASIVTVAYPTLRTAFHAGLGSVTWVGLTYLVVLVALVTAVGRFADMVGHKLLYTYGFVVFIVGSALCGLAPNLGRPGRLPGPAGGRGGDAAGQQRRHHRPGRAAGEAGPRRSGSRARHRQLGLALGPSVGGCPDRRRGLAPHLPRQRAGGHPRQRPRLVPDPAQPPPAEAGDASTGSASACSSPPSRPSCSRSPRSPTAAGHGVRGGRRPAGGVRRAGGRLPGPGARGPEPRCSTSGLFRRVPFSAGISSGLLSYLVMFGALYAVAFYLESGPEHLSRGSRAWSSASCRWPSGWWRRSPGGPPTGWAHGRSPWPGCCSAAPACGALGVSVPPGPRCSSPLAALGVGLGLFTLANNAAIMGAAPREEAGVASGVLNMTRGMGTSMGQAFAALILSVAAAGLVHPAAS